MSEFTGFSKWPWEIARELTVSQAREFSTWIDIRTDEYSDSDQMIPPIWLL